MNDQLQQFARAKLKEGLLKCTNEQQNFFKRMYSHNNMKKPIIEVVDNMNEDKLDHAMRQLERTLEMNKENES